MLNKTWSFRNTQNSFEWKFLSCTILTGLLCGIFLISFLQTFLAGIGVSLPVTVSLLLTGAIFTDLGWKKTFVPNQSKRFFYFVLTLLLCWMALFPYLCEGMMYSFSFLSSGYFSTDLSLLAPVLAGTLLLCGIPFYLFGLLPSGLHDYLNSQKDDDNSSTALVNSIFWGSVSFGIFLNLYLLAPWMGQYAGALISGIILALLSAGLWYSLSAKSHPASLTEEINPAGEPAGLKITSSIGIIILGIMASILSQVVSQLWPSFAHIVYSEVGMCLLGISIGFAASNWKKFQPVTAISFLTLFVLSVLFLFPEVVDGVLQSNYTFQTAFSALFFRTLAIGGLFIPLGIAFAMTFISGPVENTRISGFSLSLMGAGYLAGKYLLSGTVSLEQLLLGIVALQIALQLFLFWKELVPTRKLAYAFLPGLLCVIAVSIPQATNRYSEKLTAKTLFSTKVMMEASQGLPKELLKQTDESRLLGVNKSWYGTYTVWKTYGAQKQIRKNGYPLGVVSSYPEAFPQYTGEMFRTIFPLIMHENPGSILIKGNGSGLALSTSLSFPVQEIVCEEEDPELINLMRECFWNSQYTNVEADKRVRLKTVNPYLAGMLSGKKYDVIVSNPPESSFLNASSCYTREFYQNVHNQLKTDGVFCQYFRAVEFGADPIKGIFKTFVKTFNETLAVEIGANEFLLLGTDSESGLIRKDLIKRLQADHVRDVLSQIGWDWSVPLSLRVYPLNRLNFHDGIYENTLKNNWLAFSTPGEVVRWGNKQQEVLNLVAPASIRVVDLPGIDNKDPQILRRMREVVSQFEILAENPDRSVAYRKVLKKQMMTPRLAMIQQVNYDESLEQQLHPIEQHRKSYIEALGQVVKKREPELDLIHNVASYMQPYDPLVTYFAHQEVAELLERTGEDPLYELQCRLHMIFYSNAKDRSVRNIVRAIELITSHPELLAVKEEQIDLLNGLLQQLKYRWEIRNQGPELKTSIALNDLKYSIDAIEDALKTMEELAPVENFSEEDCQTRCKYIEKRLLRPLNTFRTNLLPKHHQQKSRINTEKIKENIEEELEKLDLE